MTEKDLIFAAEFWNALKSELGTAYFAVAREFGFGTDTEAIISLHPPPGPAGTGTMSLFLSTTHRGEALLSLFEADLSRDVIQQHFTEASMGEEDNLIAQARDFASALENIGTYRVILGSSADTCVFFLTYAGKPDVEGHFTLRAVQRGLLPRLFRREKDWVLHKAAEDTDRQRTVLETHKKLVLDTIEELEEASDAPKKKALKDSLQRKWASSLQARSGDCLSHLDSSHSSSTRKVHSSSESAAHVPPLFAFARREAEMAATSGEQLRQDCAAPQASQSNGAPLFPSQSQSQSPALSQVTSTSAKPKRRKVTAGGINFMR